jgi:hypothetical protein
MIQKKGRPRIAKKWASVMRHDLVVDFSVDKDVHTALHLAGSGALDLIIDAVREYIVLHQHPGGDPALQAQAAMEGLGLELALELKPMAVASSPRRAVPVLPSPLAVPAVVVTVAPARVKDGETASMAFSRMQLDDS